MLRTFDIDCKIGVAGIVVVPSPRAPRSGAPRPWHESRLAMPIVELVRHSSPPEADAVLIDDVDAGRRGARHFVGLGHRRIAVLTGPPTLTTAQQRLAGYRQALEEAAIPVDNSLISAGPYRREAARLATRHPLDGRAQPTALIATSNELVVGALQALAERHVRVPDDLSLVGFDNPELVCPAPAGAHDGGAADRRDGHGRGAAAAQTHWHGP